jgi:hypothetical protein
MDIPTSHVTVAISQLAHWLCYFNSAVNPVIYNFMSGECKPRYICEMIGSVPSTALFVFVTHQTHIYIHTPTPTPELDWNLVFQNYKFSVGSIIIRTLNDEIWEDMHGNCLCLAAAVGQNTNIRGENETAELRVVSMPSCVKLLCAKKNEKLEY